MTAVCIHIHILNVLSGNSALSVLLRDEGVKLINLSTLLIIQFLAAFCGRYPLLGWLSHLDAHGAHTHTP